VNREQPSAVLGLLNMSIANHSTPVPSAPEISEEDMQRMREFARTLVEIALARHAAGERWDRVTKRWRRPA